MVINPDREFRELLQKFTDLKKEVRMIRQATGIGAGGKGTPPEPVRGLTVEAADGIFDVAVNDKPTGRPTWYFVECSESDTFESRQTYALGPGRSLRLALGNKTLYWRAFSQFMGAEASSPLTFGKPPTPVSGGGAAAGPPVQTPPTPPATDPWGGSGWNPDWDFG